MNKSPTTASYGSWQSPIKAELLVASSVRLSEPQLIDGCSYWIELRPKAKGQNMIVQQTADGQQRDMLPAGFSARSQCHEYGGGSYTVANNVVYFVNAADQAIYQLVLDQNQCQRLSPEGNFRFADLAIDTQRKRLLCVRENHELGPGQTEERNELISLNLENPQDICILASGADFYSNPSLSPDTQHLSWISWSHPHMPWDSTTLGLAKLDAEGCVVSSQNLIQSDHESIFQAKFGPDGQLYFVSDRSQWWNLYRYNLDTQQQQALLPMEAEFATPQWVFGMSCFDFLDQGQLIACYTSAGRWQLGKLNTQSLTWEVIDTGFDDISMVQADQGDALFFAANSQTQQQLMLLRSSKEGSQPEVVIKSGSQDLDPRYLSKPQAISFTSSNDDVAHGFYYPPTNPDFEAPATELPPLIVMCHGGPTGATDTALNLKIQFWTSRGFAVFDINYRGSTGYGREYRDSLKTYWGIKDVDDVCAGAEHLVKLGLADTNKLAIKGGSAGGYTVLAALTFKDTFSAGASHYGIGDLETLARDTHKFESRYLDSMIGPYPETQALYQQRSPIHHAEHLNCPVIFFQGLEDKVVPPNQAESMHQILLDKKLPVAYVPFEGEGHGFRGAHAIVRALEDELYFYGKVFGFKPADALPAVAIDNLGEL